MIETPDGGVTNEDEDLDNYLDNLENDDSDWVHIYILSISPYNN